MQSAAACIQGDGIRGTVRFCPRQSGVMVVAEIIGLKDGFHGFHVHEGTACTGEAFSNTLSHYGSGSHPDHAGDLPPLLSCGGYAYLAVWTDRFRLRDIIGRTVVIHSRRDDFTTQPSGDSGEKIACGIINCC